MRVPTKPPVFLALAIALVSLALWGGLSIGAGFSFDDLEGVLQNPLVNGSRPALDAFRFDYWHHLGDAGHYRPLAVLSLALDWRLFGTSAAGYHATSALLHALVVLFAGLFARHLPTPRLAWAGLFAALLFGLHPALADAVAWISGRSSPLSLLPGVFFGWLVIRSRPRGALPVFLAVLAATLLGLLAKEDGFFSGALAVLAALSRPRTARPLLAAAAGLLLAVGIYLYLRAGALGVALPSAPHAPLAGAPLEERLAAAGAAMGAAWRALLWPVSLAPSFHGASWPTSLMSAPSLAGWIPWLALFALGLGLIRSQPPLAWALILGCLAWVPLQQWIPAGEVFALRFCYLPLFFLSLPTAVLILGLAERLARHRGAVPLGLTFALLLGVTTPVVASRSARPYASLKSYAQATLVEFEDDAEAWNTLGLAAEEEGDQAAARRAFLRALDSDPTYGRPHSNLGRLDLEAGRIRAAREHFTAATRLGPGNPVAWCNLGSLELSARNLDTAQAAYARATRLAPGLATAWRGTARVALRRGDVPLARAALERLGLLTPDDPALRELSLELERLAAQSH